MIYDVIIIGAGASGLFAAASFENKINGLILNSGKSPGMKLLLSGSGQCNFTKSGDIKNFLSHYGENGPKIRKPLYKFSNQALMDYFENNRLPIFQREDGKIFPKSLNSKDILNLLLLRSQGNGFHLKNHQCAIDVTLADGVSEDSVLADGLFSVKTEDGNVYRSNHLIIATGGCSYPHTGSNGNLFPILSSFGLAIVPPRPALTPIFVENYGFESLSGISFPEAIVSINGHLTKGGLLLTHNNFSGPAILDASRYASPGETLQLNYLSTIDPEHFLIALKNMASGSLKQIATILHDVLNKLQENIPKRFLELICQLSGVDPSTKASEISGKQLKILVNKLINDQYKISGTGGFNVAMCTTGGVSLNEINLNTFQTKKYPHLFIIGEALDVDGDTGGYNMQFAFSSGYLCGKNLSSEFAK